MKFFTYLAFIILVLGCSNKTIYSGKVINQEDLNNINFKNKENLISKLGNPSFIDPIDNKFYYFSEKKFKKNAFNKKTDYSYVFVFSFDEFDEILNTAVYDLTKTSDISFVKRNFKSSSSKRFIRKSIWGIGPQQELGNSPKINYKDIAAKSRRATIFVILIIGFTAGPAVSLYGSPTVSPVTAAL